MSPSDPYMRIALRSLVALAVIGQFTWGWLMQTIPSSRWGCAPMRSTEEGASLLSPGV